MTTRKEHRAQPKPMVCVEETCGMRIAATFEQARRHGWTVWLGGARCKRCSEAAEVKDGTRG